MGPAWKRGFGNTAFATCEEVKDNTAISEPKLPSPNLSLFGII